jgi:hypothetical protein
MDKYEAIVEQYRSECEFSIPMTSSERLAHFARWYEDKYLQEALTAAAMMKLHEEKPDSPCSTVRDIVVEWLEENGYDGLYSPEYGCCCIEVLIERDGRKCICTASTFSTCRPGVLKDGKIVERE